MNYTNKTALVAGGSSGIGLAIARKLASRGAMLIIVGSDAAHVDDACQDVAKETARVEGIVVDLSQPQEVAAMIGQLSDRRIDIVVNCAGFGTAGEFYQQDPAKEHNEIMVNMTALTDLCHAFLPMMIERRGGTILNVASTAAFQPLARATVYAATKAYVLSLSVALHQECKPYGVKVQALCPGPTRTQFFDKANWHNTAGTKKSFRTIEQVAATAMQLIESDRAYQIDGWRNKLTSHFARILGPSLSVRLTESFMRANHN